MVHLSIDDHAEFHVEIKVYWLHWKCLLKVSKKIPHVQPEAVRQSMTDNAMGNVSYVY